MMKYKKIFNCLVILILSFSQTTFADEILVSIDKYQITANELQSTVASSPIAIQFNTMDEKQQASIRGDLLKRLVAAKLLRLEAEKQQLDKTEEFQKDIYDFKLGLLYRFYMNKLRQSIQLSEQDIQLLRLETKGNQDAFVSARSAYMLDTYRGLRKYTVQKLSQDYHVQFYLDKISPPIMDDTILMRGDNNLKITYQDILLKNENIPPTQELIKDRLYKQAELLLIASAAEKEKVDISAQLESYKIEKLTASLMRTMENKWVPNEKVLREYFLNNPDIAKIPERRNIGMIILDTPEKAEAIRKRINQGESLFKLAGEISIDPYGKAHNGDYGWIKEGTGQAEIEEVINKLANNQLSPVIKTAKGYHLIIILDRRTGATRHYAGIKDKIRQQIIDDNLQNYLQHLQSKYKVVWHVISEKNKQGINS
ncbi:MAG: peptidylprolyl isomerase [Pseudomonadota bacterium]